MNPPSKPQINEDQEEILFQLSHKVPHDEGYMVDRMIELYQKKHGSAIRLVGEINARADEVGHILRDKDEPIDTGLLDAYNHTMVE